MTMPINTRFAPSPTGFLHVGGLRTALYAYCLAKQTGGQFILRIEDTDQTRFVEGAIESLLKSLYWSGIIPDEGVKLNNDGNIIEEGNNGSYIQSKRLDIYKKYAQQLIDQGDAYYCFCSSDRLEELRKTQEMNKLPTGYDGCCRKLHSDEVEKKISAGEKNVIRMKIPKEGEIAFNDLIRGQLVFNNKQIEDQVILKSDGFPTYHLAVVVDDHLMNIDLVIRGEEWISSTPKHLKLYEYFGWQPPQIAHLPLILNSDKSKLSKRQGDVAVEDYIQKGYLPQAMINFIAFLGWNPGDDREFFTLEELVSDISLDKIGKSGSVFNIDKLNWYNKEYIKKMTNTAFIQMAKPYLMKNNIVIDYCKSNKKSDQLINKTLLLEKERISTLSEIGDSVMFFFKIPDYDNKILTWKKSSIEGAINVLKGLNIILKEIETDEWNKEILERTIGEWIEHNNYTNGEVLWPFRVALSGQEKSPSPFEIADILGKDESISRIKLALNKLEI